MSILSQEELVELLNATKQHEKQSQKLNVILKKNYEIAKKMLNHQEISKEEETFFETHLVIVSVYYNEKVKFWNQFFDDDDPSNDYRYAEELVNS